MMIKIATLVLLPLIAGILTRSTFRERLRPFLPYTSTCNQVGILIMVWMALCTGRITSYNVCYTKLLRHFNIAKSNNSPYFTQHDNAGARNAGLRGAGSSPTVNLIRIMPAEGAKP